MNVSENKAEWLKIHGYDEKCNFCYTTTLTELPFPMNNSMSKNTTAPTVMDALIWINKHTCYTIAPQYKWGMFTCCVYEDGDKVFCSSPYPDIETAVYEAIEKI